MFRKTRFVRILQWIYFGWAFLLCLFVVVAKVETSSSAREHNVVYELPFEHGKLYRVVQGYGGVFSHFHAAALDFEMPVGTIVCAAREGEVYRYRDDSRVGGLGPRYRQRANYLIIRHDDGSFGCYWHLQYQGVLVKQGRVEKGQPIARSGATGYVLDPHLHFSVKQRLSYAPDSYVRTRFRTAAGNLFLKAFRWYGRPLTD